MNPNDVQVLIIGGGPVGLTMGLLLAQQGVRSMIIEQKDETSRAPRAHVLNRRTIEVYRELGLDNEILAQSTAPQNMRNVVWADTLAGNEIGRFLSWGLDPSRLRATSGFSPVRVVNFPQHRLEPMLKKAAEENPNIQVCFSSELLSFTDEEDRVTAVVRFPSGVSTVRAQYLVGADGGRSAVREMLGIKLEGQGGLRSAVNTYFTADLGPWMKDRPGLLYLLLNTASTGVLIGASVPKEWVFMQPLPPGVAPSLPTPDEMITRIKQAVGVDDLDVEIHDIQSWNTNALVAGSYGRRRVWLAGDAAHLNSPTGGLGLNTGAQDAHGLAWRLTGLIHGWARPSTLIDYENERRAIGKINIGQSLRNLELLGLVREAVDLPAAPGPGSNPEALAKAIAELSEDGQAGDNRRAKVREAISAQYEQLDALGIDLGFRYPVTGEDETETSVPADRVKDYLPSTEPGARLPHAWLEVSGRRVSTLDLIGRGAFTVILGEDAAGWTEVLSGIPEKVPVRTVRIGSTCTAFDLEGQWELVRGVGAQGAILVRPDGHVAWRGDSVSEKLIEAIYRSTGLPENAPSKVGEPA